MFCMQGSERDYVIIVWNKEGDILAIKDVLYIKARKMDFFTSSALPLQP